VTTGNEKKVSNPNVLIELGYAARSIGWERTILVLNTESGEADALPFDVLQHRWPIEYRLTEKTRVRQKRFESLTSALEAALTACEKHALSRAEEMAAALDTGCLDFLAEFETNSFIEMPLPAKTMSQLITGMHFNSTVRRLIELGALTIVDTPYIGYSWTHSGRHMIEAINRKYPQILYLFRQQKSQT
jgi:hypothetical protein